MRGAEDYAKPLNEIADLVDSAGAKPSAGMIASTAPAKPKSDEDEKPDRAAPPTPKAVGPSKPREQHDLATSAHSATADFAPLTTETVDLSVTDLRARARSWARGALRHGKEGAIVVADVMAGRACPIASSSA